MRKDGLGAMFERFPDLIVLQFLTRNVLGHKRSPAIDGTLYASTGVDAKAWEAGKRQVSAVEFRESECNFEYSALARTRIGRPAAARFERVKKS